MITGARPEPDKKGQSLSYRADVDGLRALAVLLVIGYHAFPGRLQGGFIGVDVFFVISGYLISGLILSALDRRTFRFSEFYGRRIRRIFPALAVALFVTIVLSWFVLTPDELAQLGKHTLSSAAFLANITFWREAGYFDTLATHKPLLHLWSLGVEEQFYILWPLILVTIWRFRGHRMFRFLSVMAIASFATSVWLSYTSPSAAFYLPFTRFWELLVGAALAYAELSGFRPTWRAISWLGVPLIILGAVLIDRERVFPGWWALLPTAGTALMIAAGPNGYVNRRLLSLRPIVFIGLISYPLYLFHWPLLSFLNILQDGASFGTDLMKPRIYRIVAVAVALILSALTFLLIERPIRRGKIRRPVIVTSCVAVIAMGLLGAILQRGHGFPIRGSHPVTVAETLGTPNVIRGYDEDSFARSVIQQTPSARHDFFADQPTSKDDVIAVVGDSHANRFFVGLESVLGDRRVINFGRGGCLPFLGIDTVGCQPFVDQGLEFVARRPDVHEVVLTAFFARYVDGRTPIRSSVALAESVKRTAEFLVNHGKRVVIVLDVPELKEACERRAIPVWESEPVRCDLPRAEHERVIAGYAPAIEAATSKMWAVSVFDPTDTFCDAQFCRGTLNGRPLYFSDGNHLTIDGAKLVAAAFLHDSSATRTVTASR